MDLTCQHCNKVCSTKGALKTHQTTSRYCLKLQDTTAEVIYNCDKCTKTFTIKSSYDRHLVKHLPDSEVIKLKNEIEELKQKNIDDNLKNALLEITEIKEELKITKEQLKLLQEENVKQLQLENKDNKKKIDTMTKKYVKKQERVQYEVPNVIYVLTTASLKKERRYILGKAGNLTDRLSTYNKTDEHEVVYYQGCGNSDNMPLVESLVFHKLKEYREQANRERFILPEDKELEIFIQAIKSSIDACK